MPLLELEEDELLLLDELLDDELELEEDELLELELLEDELELLLLLEELLELDEDELLLELLPLIATYPNTLNS